MKMKNQLYYEITVAGCVRHLPICPLNDELSIAGFVIIGDPELTQRCAEELLKKAPEYDYILTAESKGIPLAHEMARLNGDKRYFVARKATKLYMANVVDVTVRSITTDHLQHLYIDGADAEQMKGKRVLIVDDVISTGESLRALECLADQIGANICGKMTILAEGDAADRKDIVYIEKLPLFTPEGQPID